LFYCVLALIRGAGGVWDLFLRMAISSLYLSLIPVNTKKIIKKRTHTTYEKINKFVVSAPFGRGHVSLEGPDAEKFNNLVLSNLSRDYKASMQGSRKAKSAKGVSNSNKKCC